MLWRSKSICVLYGQNYASAERNYLMPRLTDLIFTSKFKLDPKGRVRTLQIETTNRDAPDVKARNLKRLRQMRGFYRIQVFASALGSSIVQYLQDLFFNATPDCFHVNSFSTVPSLSVHENLMRVVPTDLTSTRIFVEWTKLHAKRVVLVFDSGLWSTQLSTAIRQALRPGFEVVDFPFEIGQMSDAEVAVRGQQLSTFLQPDTMLIYLLDSNRGELVFQALTPNPNSFSILIGDAGASYKRTPELLAFFVTHNTQIIQPFRGGDAFLQKTLQDALDASLVTNPVVNPTGSNVISPLITYTITALDLAYYIAQLPPEIRSTRQRYINTIFDANLDMANAVYEIDEFTVKNDEQVTAIASEIGGQVHISQVVG
jgi:hypothetical protein